MQPATPGLTSGLPRVVEGHLMKRGRQLRRPCKISHALELQLLGPNVAVLHRIEVCTGQAEKPA
jgi:hypothetical protein